MANAVMTPFEKVPSIGATVRTPEERAKDLQDALNWLKNKEKDESFGDPMGVFRKLDKLLPRKRGQTPEERAREIEGAIDWIRSKEENLADDETDPSFSKVSTGVVAKRSPEQRAHDVSNALNWLRHKGKSNASKYDPTGEFKKLNSLIPSKIRAVPNGTLEAARRYT
jgi:hypothetical protein